MTLGRGFAAAGAAAILLAAACASGSKTGTGAPSSATSSSDSSHHGTRVLNAVVTQRDYEAPGSSAGGSYAGSGSWYLEFEAEDGSATVHYRFPVTRQQYARYPEGSRVQIVVMDNILQEIRPGKD